MDQKSKRIAILDIAKGISIILMTVTHVPHIKSYEWIFNANLIVVIFKMPLFIFISGFLFSPRLPVKEFILRKIDGLLKPTFHAVLFIVILNTIRENFHIRHSSPNFYKILKTPFLNFIEGIRLGNVNKTDAPLWFIFPLFIALVIMRIYYHIIDKKIRWGYWLVIAPSFLFLCSMTYTKNAIWGIGLVSIFLLYLAIGYSQKTIARKMGMQQYFFNHWAGLISLLVFSAMAYFKEEWNISLDLRTETIGNETLTFLMSIAGIYLMLYLCNYIGRIEFLKRFLIKCSRVSFIILAFHLILANIFTYWMPFRLIPVSPWKDLAIFIIDIPLCLLIYEGIKRTAYLRLFFLPLKSINMTRKERKWLLKQKQSLLFWIK